MYSEGKCLKKGLTLYPYLAMILAAMPNPAKLPPPCAGADILADGSLGGLEELSVREGGGAMAAPMAVEKQIPQISGSW
jgi:hypothetical protein